MKHIVAIFAICILTLPTYAQEKQTSSVKQIDGTDYNFMYSSKGKMYAFGFQADISPLIDNMELEFGAMSNLKFGKDEYSTITTYIGLGAKRRYIFGESFMINFHIAPYIGLSSYDYPGHMATKSDSEFTYGATADLKAGFKLLETNKGNDIFLNLGYKIYAGEFKTEGMFKNGYFCIGITQILSWQK